MPVSSWDVVLRDGSTLHIRPALPTDGAAIRAFFETLSDESRRQRFLAACSPSAVAMPELIHNDPSAQFSLIAEDGRGIVALASYFRDPAAPSQAECAVAVADVFQGRGLGTRLIELLAEVAHAMDISVFTAYALYDNRRMLDVFRECGYPADSRGQRWLVTRFDWRLMVPVPRSANISSGRDWPPWRRSGRSSLRSGLPSSASAVTAASGPRYSRTCGVGSRET